MNDQLLRCKGILSRLSLIFILFIVAFSGWAQTEPIATVTTDKPDYHPGEYVLITGAEWQPGEKVDFTFKEIPKPDSCINSHDIYAIADTEGKISNSQFLVKENHLGVTFILTATGQSSGKTAETIFTDADFTSETTGNWNNPASWRKNGVPQSGTPVEGVNFPGPDDNVSIGNNHVISLSANHSCKTLLVSASGNATTKLKIDNFNLTVTGNTTITGSSGNKIAQIEITTGILNVDGDLYITGHTSKPLNANLAFVIPGGTGTINLKGNWTNDGGTFTPLTGLVNFNNTGIDQTVLGSGNAANQTFNRLTVAKGSRKLIIGGSTSIVTIGGANPVLTMTSGNIDVGPNTLELGTGVTSSTVGTLSYSSGNIIGNFKRWFNTTGSKQFPLGKNGNSGTSLAAHNAQVNFTNLIPGSLTGKFIASNPGSQGLPVTENSQNFNSQFTEGYWSLISGNSLASNNYDLELRGEGFNSNTLNSNTRIVKRPDIGGNWTLNGNHVAAIIPVAKRSNLSGFSSFALVSSSSIATTTVANNATAAYGDAAVNLTANVTPTAATGNVEFFIDNVSVGIVPVSSGLSTLNYNLAGKNAGDYTIKANYLGAGSHTASSSDPATLTVNKKALSITAPSIATRDYDGTAIAGAVTVGTLSGFVGSETVTATGSAADYSSPNVDTYIGVVVTYTLADGTNDGLATNYSLAAGSADGEITPLALSITAPSIATRDYDGTAIAGAVTVGTLSGFVGSETVTATGSAADYSSPSVDTYTGVVVTYTLADGTNDGLATNYSLAAGSADGEITPLALSITAPSIATRDYDGTAIAGAVTVGTLSGFVGSETVTATALAADYSSPNVDTYTGVVVTYTLADGTNDGLATNYSLAAGSADGEITPLALSITAPSIATRDYDGTAIAGAVTVGTLSGFVGSETVTATALAADYSSPNVDTYTGVVVTYTLADGTNDGLATNYSLAAGSADGEITPLALSITAPSIATRDYDGTAIAGAVTVGTLSGFVGSETVTATGSAADYSSPNVDTYIGVVVTYTLADGTNDGLATNYSLAAGSADGEITPLALSITAPSIATRDYDGTAIAGAVTVGTLSGFVGSETVTATALAADYSSPNVDTYTGVVVTYTLADGTNDGLATNYSLAAGSADGEITPLALSITAPSIATRDYDGTAIAGAVTVGTLSGFVGSETVTATALAADYSSPNVDTYIGVVVTYTLADGTNDGLATNYSLAAGSADGEITPLALSITAPSIATRDYDGTAIAGAVTVGTLSGFVGSETVTATGSAADYSSPNVDTYIGVVVTYTLADGTNDGLATNYSLAAGSADGEITPLALSITAPSIATRDYDGTAIAGAVTVGTLSGFVGSETVTATALAADYSSPNVDTYTGVVVTYTLADGTNDGLATNYSLAAGSADGEITPLALSITAPSIATRDYDGTAIAGAVTVGTLSGFVGSETVTATALAADYSSPNVDTYIGVVVTYTLADGTNDGLATNYSLAAGSADGEITPLALSITAPSIATRDYDGTAIAGAVTVGTLSGFVGSETVTATGSAADYSSPNVDTYIGVVVTYTLADGTNDGLATNYSLAAGSADGEITPLALSITAPSIATRDYDGTAIAGAVTVGTLSGFVGSETVTATGSAADYSSPNVDTYTGVVVTYTLADGTNDGLATNYSLAAGSADGEITPLALSITAPSIATRDYDGTAIAGAVTVGTLSGFVGSETVTATGSAADYSSPNVDTYIGVVVTYTLADGTNDGLATNYSLAAGSADGEITPLALSITAPSIATRDYDGTAIAGAVTVGTLSGFVGSETVTATGSAADYSSPNVDTYIGVVVTYTLADGTNDGLATNYSLAAGSADGEITPLALSITAPSIATRDYDGTAIAGAVTVGTLSGFVGSETVTATALAADYSSPNVDTYIGVVVTYTLADGTNDGLATNYSLAAGSADGEITPLALSITAPSIATRDYDGTAIAGAVTVGTLSGFVGSETVTATGSAADYSSPNVDTYTGVVVTYTLADGTNDGLATNYSLAAGSADGEITPLALSITAPSIATRDYDGTAIAGAVTVGTLSGFVGCETVTATGSAADYSSPNVDTYIGVVVTYTLADGTNDGLATNYSLAAGSADGEITPLALSITAPSIATRDYDGTAIAGAVTVGTLSGFVESETVTATALAADYSSPNVDTYTGVVVTYTLADGTNDGLATNYSLAAGSADGEITIREVNVTAQSDTKIYDGDNTSNVLPVGDALQGADTYISEGTQSFDDKDVASSKTITASGASIDDGNGGLNYNINYVDDTTGEILKRDITITVDADQFKYCGLDDPIFSYSYTENNDSPEEGLAGSDVFDGALTRDSGQTIGNYNILETGLTIMNGVTDVSDNYDITFEGDIFEIKGSTLDASASSQAVQINTAPNTAIFSAKLLDMNNDPISEQVISFEVLDNLGNSRGSISATTLSNGIATTSTFNTSSLESGVYSIQTSFGCAQSTAYLSIFDPNGGFVTGGGWIDSPASAMSSGVTGKANFGFNAKYKNGKNNMNEVDGNTNFQFKAGDLHFSSIKHNDMELVIAGRKATYTGTGTINGRGNHKFRVVAIDGDFQNGTGPDKFRIKIWDDGSDSQIYYDNQRGMSEAGEDATVLGGGSIVIHKPKGKGQEDVTKGTPIIMEDLRPEILETLAASPNPVVSYSTVRFSVKEDAIATLRLYDNSGRLVETLFTGAVKAFENYNVDLQRRNLMSGIYIVKLTTAKGHSYDKRIIIN